VKQNKAEQDWIVDLNKKVTEFFATATAEDIRNLLKKSNYEKHTGINPDTLEIRELAADEP